MGRIMRGRSPGAAAFKTAAVPNTPGEPPVAPEGGAKLPSHSASSHPGSNGSSPEDSNSSSRKGSSSGTLKGSGSRTHKGSGRKGSSGSALHQQAVNGPSNGGSSESSEKVRAQAQHHRERPERTTGSKADIGMSIPNGGRAPSELQSSGGEAADPASSAEELDPAMAAIRALEAEKETLKQGVLSISTLLEQEKEVSARLQSMLHAAQTGMSKFRKELQAEQAHSDILR